MKKRFSTLTLVSFCLIGNALGMVVQEQDSIKAASFERSKEEKNRNVMLNAGSNTGPRDVNIGLPFRGDIIILENDLPVVAYFWPTIPTYAWRMSNSFSGMGLLSFSEGALTWGKVGFAVKSEDRMHSRRFRGYASMYTNNFGSSKYEATVTGPLGKKGWGYMLNAYQHNERGNGTNYRFTSWEQRTTLLKAAVSKKYKQGSVRLLYKAVDSKGVTNNNSPLMYLGDGETEPLDNFELGTASYLVGDGMLPYADPKTGEAKWASLKDDKFSRSTSHNLYVSGNHKFNNDMKLTYSTMFQKMNTPQGLAYPISAQILDNRSMPDGYPAFASYLNSGKTYEGDYIQMVTNQLIPQSDIKTLMSRVELTKDVNGHKLRLGATHQYNRRQYESLGGLYLISVEENPSLLHSSYLGINAESGLMMNAQGGFAGGYGGLTDDSFSKLGLYFSDDFSPTEWLDLGFGARVENQNREDRHYTAVSGNEKVTDGGYIDYKFKNNWNTVGIANAIVKLTKSFGLLGSFTYNSWHDSYWDYAHRDENNVPTAASGEPYARTTLPLTFRQEVIYYDGGVFLNLGNKLNIVSKITHISKNNIRDPGSLITYKKDSKQQQDVGPLFYGISTTGWATDIVTNPFKNFNLHFLLTLQKPEYKDYAFTTRFTDPDTGAEDVESYDYNGKIIPALSQVLMEIDPSYSFMKRKAKVWLSLRYFGKQYGNRTNAFEYNGWWENFGGIDYTLSRNVKIGFQVVNFLNQRGVKGEVQGAAQTTKQEVLDNYVGHPIVASAIRPRTFELKVDFKF